MRKSDLIKRVAQVTGVPKVDVLVTIEAVFKEIKKTVHSGEDVNLRGFGSFQLKRRKQKMGRHLKKNIALVVPEHDIPYFKPAVEFMDLVRDIDKTK